MTIDDRADRVACELERLAVETGVLVAVSEGDDTVVLSAGTDALGREPDDATVVPLFCLAKPLVAAAVDEAVRAGDLSLDDQLGDLIDVHASLAPITIVELLEHRGGIGGPHGVGAGLVGQAHRRALLAERPAPPDHETCYSEVLGFEAVGWCLERATGNDVGTLVSRSGIWLGEMAADIVGRDQLWASEIRSPDGISYPLLFPFASAAILDPNPGFGGYCQPAAYLHAVTTWLTRPDAPREIRPVFDGAFGRPVSWKRGVCTSLAQELHVAPRPLIGHLGFMGSACFAFDPTTGVSVFAVLSRIDVDVASTRRTLGQIIDAATAPTPQLR